MKYTKKNLKEKTFQFTITLDEKEWQQAVEEAYQKNKSKYNMQGFRKGHVPRKVLEKSYGEGVFYEDAIDGCFYKYYFEVLSKEKDITPIAAPEIDIKEISNAGLTLLVTVEGKPDVTLGEYKGLTINKDEVKVTDKQIEEEVQKTIETRVKFVEVERAVQLGDMVTLDFSGSIDGVKFEGGTASDYELEIGSHSFIDNFEEQLVGLKVGDKKDVNVKFPELYHEESLKGKPAVFAVVIKAIKEKKYPELNDTFASEVSEFETLADWKADLKKKMEVKLNTQAQQKQENDLIDMIVDKATVAVPQVLINQQVEDFIKDFENRLAYQGLNLDGYLQYTKQTIEDLKKSRQEDAKRTVKTRLVLEKILSDEKIKVTESDILKKVNENNKDNKKTIEDIKKDFDPDQLNYLQNSILLNKMMDFLKKNNNL